MMARDAIERRFGVQFAFQNRHRAAVFRLTATTACAAFTSPRGPAGQPASRARRLLN